MSALVFFTLERLVRKDAPSSAVTSRGRVLSSHEEELGAGPETSGRTSQGLPLQAVTTLEVTAQAA